MFGADGYRVVSTRRKRGRGSVFDGVLHLTREQFQEAEQAVRMARMPTEVVVTFNGERLEPRSPLHMFAATLDTEIADDDGFLRKSRRMTHIQVFAVKEGEVATLYEMGLPVVATGDKWHVDIGQKVPLTVDRTGVPEGFLRAVRTFFVFNEMNEFVAAEETNENWVRQATSDRRCSQEAIRRALDLRFGEKRVSYDPSDREANCRAVAEGLHGDSWGGRCRVLSGKMPAMPMPSFRLEGSSRRRSRTRTIPAAHGRSWCRKPVDAGDAIGGRLCKSAGTEAAAHGNSCGHCG